MFFRTYHLLYTSYLLCLISASLFLSKAHGQEKENFIKKTFHKFFSSTQADSSRSGSFLILPALGYAQETGLEFGIISTYNFYVDKTDLNSKTSTIMLAGTMTTESQKNIKLQTDIWTKNNDYHIISELRYRDWPYNFYGIGNDTWLTDEDRIGQDLFRARIDVEKKISNRFYAGININYENFSLNDFEKDGIYASSPIYGKTGGQHMALGISALYDSRNNTTFTTRGLYSRIRLSYSPKFFSDEDFVGTQLEADVRSFHPISSRFSVATQGLLRGTYGKNSPFYVLNELGGSLTMRGYYLGRYIDRNFMTVQAEARYRFHPRIGATAFVGTGSTFSSQQSMRLVPSYGGGIRYFFSLEHSSTVRFDYAFGEKRPGEKRQQGFYLSFAEAF